MSEVEPVPSVGVEVATVVIREPKSELNIGYWSTPNDFDKSRNNGDYPTELGLSHAELIRQLELEMQASSSRKESKTTIIS